MDRLSLYIIAYFVINGDVDMTNYQTFKSFKIIDNKIQIIDTKKRINPINKFIHDLRQWAKKNKDYFIIDYIDRGYSNNAGTLLIEIDRILMMKSLVKL